MQQYDLKSADMKKVINICGTCSGCGATFVAISLALVMANETDGVTFLEERKTPGSEKSHPAPFYEISLDKHITERRFADFFALKAAGEKTDNRANMFHNVNWAVRNPGYAEKYTKEVRDKNMSEGISCFLMPEDVAGRYIIWDDRDGMEEADLILAVVDPLPSKVMASCEKVKQIKQSMYHKVRWVFNGGRKTDVKAAEKFLGIKADFVLPAEHREKFYEAQKRCLFLTDPANELDRTAPRPSDMMQETLEEIAFYIKTIY